MIGRKQVARDGQWGLPYASRAPLRGFNAVPAAGSVGDLKDIEDVLGVETTRFVERFVRTLLTWDILIFFHRNPDAVLDMEGLAARLGRRADELRPEIDELCRDRLLKCAGGLVRYQPDATMRAAVDDFAQACQERGRRLALIALVLKRLNPRSR